MSTTDLLKEQHSELLDVASALSLHLQIDRIAETPEVVHELLNNLAGRLRVHLTMEDRGLYPLLFERNDEYVKKMTRDFMDDMGGSGRVRQYMLRWSVPRLIAEHPRDFSRETRELLQELSSRIDREESELYPLFMNRSAEGG